MINFLKTENFNKRKYFFVGNIEKEKLNNHFSRRLFRSLKPSLELNSEISEKNHLAISSNRVSDSPRGGGGGWGPHVLR